MINEFARLKRDVEKKMTEKCNLKKKRTRTARACNARYEENNDKEHASWNELEKTRMRWVCNFKTDKEKREMADIRLIKVETMRGKSRFQ